MAIGKRVIVLLALQLTTTGLATAGPSPQQDVDDGLARLEGRLTRTMDELNGRDSIDIYGDMVTLEKVADDAARSPNEESDDPFVSGVEKFLRTRKIHVNLPDDASTAGLFGRAFGQRNVDIELRGLTQGASEARTKLKRIVMPLLLLLGFKTLIILPIAITVIGLIGIKALGGSILAIVLSSAVALKAILTPPPPPRVTYGVVKPHEIHHDHWHRSEQEINQPYRGWAPEYNNEQYPYQEIQ